MRSARRWREHALRVQAEQELAGHQLRLAELETAWAAAAWRAEHPGEAPRTSPMALGAVSAADMTEEERQLIGGLALLAGIGRSEPTPAAPDPAAAIKDRSWWRVLGPGVMIPPEDAMNGPTIEDAEKAISDAGPQLDRAAGAADDAVKADTCKQAAQRLAYAARVLDGLAGAAGPPAAPRGPSLSLPGVPARPAVFSPGPR